MKIAPTNDDLWLWLMGVLKGTKVYVVGDNDFPLYYIGDTQKYSLTSINDHGDSLYFVQLQNIFERYPKVLNVLKEEYKKFLNCKSK